MLCIFITDSNDSLDNFSYESSDMAKRIFKEATEVQFEGVTVCTML